MNALTGWHAAETHSHQSVVELTSEFEGEQPATHDAASGNHDNEVDEEAHAAAHAASQQVNFAAYRMQEPSRKFERDAWPTSEVIDRAGLASAAPIRPPRA